MKLCIPLAGSSLPAVTLGCAATKAARGAGAAEKNVPKRLM